MPVIHLVKCLYIFNTSYLFFIKDGTHTALPYSKIGLTNYLKSGTIISLFILNVM